MSLGSLIVLMTDFGAEHWYDAAMKGEILRRAPEAKILDLSHHVPRQQVEQGAFMLHCAIDSFPKDTIFLCVVDPGIGSDRRTLAGRVGGFSFVGPDNGLVTPLVNRSEADEIELHEIKTPLFRNPKVSQTFHGRDVFAPAAAKLYLGEDARMAGPRVTDPVLLPNLNAEEADGGIKGKIMMIDHFGNAVTNIAADPFRARLANAEFELSAQRLTLNRAEDTYANTAKGQPVAYWGSSGYLEIAVNFGSAAHTYKLQPSDSVEIAFK